MCNYLGTTVRIKRVQNTCRKYLLFGRIADDDIEFFFFG